MLKKSKAEKDILKNETIDFFESNLKQCKMCPRHCRCDRTLNQSKSLGFCGLDDKIKCARASLHMWEEPCISGTNGSGTVFFSHCQLGCVFCQNNQISNKNFGVEQTPAKLCDVFLSLEKQGANNINLVTPTPNLSGIVKAIYLAKEKGIKIPFIYNCGGYEDVQIIKNLNGLIDVYLPDIKYFSPSLSKRYSKAEDYFEKASLAVEEMVKQKNKIKFAHYNGDKVIKSGVIIRHLMLPSYLFDTKKIVDYVSDNFKNQVLFSLMSQYTPLDEFVKNNKEQYPNLCEKLKPSHYQVMIDYVKKKGLDGYIQDGESATESFIPIFDGFGLK